MIDYEARMEARLAEKMEEEHERLYKRAKVLIDEDHKKYEEPFSVCIDKAIRIFQFDESTRQKLYKDFNVTEEQ